MSGALNVLKFLEAATHLGGPTLTFRWSSTSQKEKCGACIRNLKRTWEKLSLAAQAIAAIENAADVSIISSGNTSQPASSAEVCCGH
ncbi:40S ribosomal protein SA [Microtus ochrogaster]|uniref:40S ribosomal protein SA n=1 Tax=Microtus ochrogaster TaxID=79684 RepID=A0A8J6GDK0_MICOH|nr:40S ribosomal protein SA [Microtus ochrogaster]